MAAHFTIGTLASAAGVNVETIRFYQKRRLLEAPEKPVRGIRRYTTVHAQRIRFIRQAQQLGFSLDEVSDLLALEDGRHCKEAGELGKRKLALVRERIAQLNCIEKVLATVVAQCQRNRGKVRCPLVASLERDQH